jgi:hypothetical protein
MNILNQLITKHGIKKTDLASLSYSGFSIVKKSFPNYWNKPLHQLLISHTQIRMITDN